MAEEVALKVSVDVGEGGKSLKSLKEEFKNTQKELDGLQVGSEKYIKTLGKLGKIKDEIGDLNEEIAAFKPEGKVEALGKVIGGVASGFEAATGAAALFGGENKDLEKTLIKVQAAMAFTEGIKGLVSLGDGFKVLGNIIKSNPIFLIASIVIGVGVALYALKDKLGIVGKAFDAIGDVISFIIEKVKAFTDAIGLTSFAYDKLTKSISDNNDRAKKAIVDRYDSEIAAARRAGKETETLEILKADAILKYNRKAIEALYEKQRAGNKLTEDELKHIEELKAENEKLIQETLDLSDRQKDIELANSKKVADGRKKDLDKSIDDYNKYVDAKAEAENAYADKIDALKKKQRQQEKDAMAQGQKDAEALAVDSLNQMYSDNVARAETQAINDQNSFAARQAVLDARRDQELSNTQLTEDQKAEVEAKYAKQSKQLKQEQADQALNVTAAGINAAAALSDLYFSSQMKKAKGNAAAELAIKKKQFKVEKAFSIARATIDGIRSVQTAISTTSPPLSYVLAAFNAALSIANIAKIASTKFEGGETGGGGGSVPIPSVAAPGSSSAPSLNAPNNSSTLLNPDGTVKKNTIPEQPLVKAIVTETDITKTQGRVNTIKEMATIR